METTLIGIGGINLRINLPDHSFQLEDSYFPFRGNSISVMGDWHIHPEPIPNAIVLLDSRSKSSRIRDISHSNGKLIFRLWWEPNETAPWKAALMDPTGQRGDIWLKQTEEEPVSYPLFAIDLLLFSYLLLFNSGIIIHAAAVETEAGVYLFPAPSGGGKSTWSDLAAANPGWRVLGEDKVIVRKVGDSYQVFGTPWNPRPEFQVARHATLKGIYFLRHDRENRISQIGKIEIAKKLLQDAALPFQKRDELDKVLTIIKEIAESIPAYQFGFRPDQSAIDYFQSFI